MQQQTVILKCPCCEQSSSQLLCLSCGHSLCQRCVSVFTQKRRYFKCHQCGQFIVQQPVPNHYVNDLAQRLQREPIQNIEPKITKREFCYQSSFAVTENFQPMQLTLNQTIVILHNSHSKYADYLSLKFITQLSKILYVNIAIQKGDKAYQINKELDFADARSVVLPIGPRSKLFTENQQSLFTITISNIPTRLAELAQAIFASKSSTLTAQQLNQNIENIQEQLSQLSKDDSLQLLRQLMKQEQIRSVFNNQHIQQLIIKSEVLFNTGDYRLLGQQLNFDALKDLIKQAKIAAQPPPSDSFDRQFALESAKNGAKQISLDGMNYEDQVLKSALLQQQEEHIKRLEQQLTNIQQNTVPKADFQRFQTLFTRVQQQNKQLQSTNQMIKENNAELTERLALTASFLQGFDLISTPLSSSATKAVTDLLRGSTQFYAANIVIKPGNLIVKSNHHLTQKIAPSADGSTLIPLNLNPGIKITVTPFQNKSKFKLIKSNKFIFGGRSLLQNEAMNKLCEYLTEGNAVLIE